MTISSPQPTDLHRTGRRRGLDITRVVGPTIRYLPSVVAPVATQVATLAILARKFTSPEFGLVVLGQTGSNLITLLTASWAGTAAIRYLSSDVASEARTNMYRHIRILVWCQVLAMGLVGALLVLLTSGSVRTIVVLSLATGLPAALTIPSLYALRASDRSFAFNALSLLRHILPTAAGLGWIAANGSSARGYQAAYGISLLAIVPVLESVANGWRRIVRVSGLRSTLSSETVRRLVQFGLPLIPAYLFSQILAFADRYLIAALKGEAAAGAYSAGYSLASLPIQFVVGALALACGPEIVRAWESRGAGAARQVITKWATFDLVVTGAIALVLAVGASWFAPIVLGRDFPDVSTVVRLVAIGELIIGVQWFAQRPLVLNERTSPILYGMAVAAGVNIAANLIFIPGHGIVAAGWTTVASNLVYAGLILFASSRVLSSARDGG